MATIGPTMHVRGEVHSSEDLVIEGRVEGAVQVPDASLTIESQASVDGAVRGRRIVIRGSVHGTVSGSDRIEMDASASVTGDLSANHVIVVDGASFNGRIDMNRRTIAFKVARHRAEQAEQERARRDVPSGQAVAAGPDDKFSNSSGSDLRTLPVSKG